MGHAGFADSPGRGTEPCVWTGTDTLGDVGVVLGLGTVPGETLTTVSVVGPVVVLASLVV